jgi:hypothetical protein
LEHRELLIKYYKGLINSCFKIIPIYNGEKFKSKEIIKNPEDAYKDYQIYLSNLLVEIYGNSQLFFQSENSIKLISLLKGMIKEIRLNENTRVKQIVRECIGLCKKIIIEIERS